MEERGRWKMPSRQKDNILNLCNKIVISIFYNNEDHHLPSAFQEKERA
jgi:hypothetical protein